MFIRCLSIIAYNQYWRVSFFLIQFPNLPDQASHTNIVMFHNDQHLLSILLRLSKDSCDLILPLPA